MKLRNFIVEKAIRLDLKGRDKRSVIREMVEALRDAGCISSNDVEALVKALMKREEIGSTGIGKGVAVPHTRHACVDRLMATMARSVEGVDFAALDGQPVHILFLVLSPPDEAGPHIAALERVFSILKNDDFCRFVMDISKPKEAIELIKEAEEMLE